MVTQIVKWASIPILLIVAVFSSLAGSYEPLLDSLICVSAILFIQRAVLFKQYFWGAGLVAVAVAFSPLFLVVKVFLLMGLLCVGSMVVVVAAFRPGPVATL